MNEEAPGWDEQKGGDYMFANLTVAEAVMAILAFVAGLVAFIKGVEYLIHKAGAAFKKMVMNALAPTNERMDILAGLVEEVGQQALNADLSSCKNFLVRFLADIEQGRPVDEVETTRFWETYDHYIRDLGQNSYIKEKVGKLKSAGKL